MMTASDAPVVITAFLAGILGSGHCFGMCGGIAGALGALGSPPGQTKRWLPGLLFNSGRLVSYMLLGVLGAWLLSRTGDTLEIPRWSRWLRGVTAAMIFLIGLRFLFNIRFLDHVEKAGAGLWRRIQPLAVRLSARTGAGSRLGLGICWGLLPCGLVYSILLLAASTASARQAALTMLAFGTGTLPSMLGVTWMSPMLGTLMTDPVVRRLAGFSLLILALWSLFMMSGTVPEHH